MNETLVEPGSDTRASTECTSKHGKSRNPQNRNDRRETDRFKPFTFDQLMRRDKTSLDIFWLKGESLEDTANLPPPGVIAAEVDRSIRKRDPEFHIVPIMPSTHGSVFYILDPPELPSLRSLYFMIEQTKHDSNIELSLTRFNSSYSKNIGDALPDLVICLETLYLSGDTEKSFRLRSYMTRFLENMVDNRIEMWHFLKEAYDLRSRIVHDGIRMPHKIRVEGQKEPIGALAFLGQLEEYVRLSLKHFLELESRNNDLTVLKIRRLIEEAIINPEFDWDRI